MAKTNGFARVFGYLTLVLAVIEFFAGNKIDAIWLAALSISLRIELQ